MSWRSGTDTFSSRTTSWWDGGVAAFGVSSSLADAAGMSSAVVASDSETGGLGPLRSLHNAGDACGVGVGWASESSSSCAYGRSAHDAS